MMLIGAIKAMSSIKNSKIGICKLCGKTTDLIQGHVIPKKFCDPLITEVTDATSKKFYTRKIRGRGLKAYYTCHSCDNGVLKQYDDVAYEFLLHNKYEITSNTEEFFTAHLSSCRMRSGRSHVFIFKMFTNRLFSCMLPALVMKKEQNEH